MWWRNGYEDGFCRNRGSFLTRAVAMWLPCQGCFPFSRGSRSGCNLDLQNDNLMLDIFRNELGQMHRRNKKDRDHFIFELVVYDVGGAMSTSSSHQPRNCLSLAVRIAAISFPDFVFIMPSSFSSFSWK
jgi:hypothetical protein